MIFIHMKYKDYLNSYIITYKRLIMEIEDFLPKYPNINKKKDDVLNPYEDDFYDAIFRKKEFYDERLDPIEDLPSERGVLMKHQTIIAR